MSDSDIEVIMPPVPIPRTTTTTPTKEVVKELDFTSPSPSPAKISNGSTTSATPSVEEKENSILEELIGDMTRQILETEVEAAAAKQAGNATKPTGTSSTGVDSDNHLVIDLDDDDDMVESMKENIDKSLKPANVLRMKRPTQDVKRILRKMSREELEEIMYEKIVECVNAHSSMGVLRTKVARLTVNNDRLFQKSTSLQKQVAELSKSMRQITENHARNPKLNQKAYIPLKFYRSVGLQVNTDHSKNAGRAVPGSIRLPPAPAQPQLASSVPKPTIPAQKPAAPVNANPTTSIATNTNGTVTNGIASQSPKRVNKPTITVAELQNQVQADPAKIPRRVGPGSSPVRLNNSAPIRFPSQSQQQLRSTAPALTSTTVHSANAPNNTALRATTPISTVNTIIDLTDDSKPTTPTPPATTGTSYNIVNQNGVQYRLVNRNGIPQGMQLVQSSPTGVLRLVGPQGQTRPVLFQQQSQARSPAQPRLASPVNQQYIVRTVNPVGSGMVRSGAAIPNHVQKPRPIMVPNRTTAPTNPAQSGGQRLQSPANPNNNSITVPRNQYNTPTSATVSAPIKKFELPELPQAAANGQPRRGNKDMPPRPDLTLQEQADGIVLSWTHKLGPNHAEILTYQIYACQEPLLNGGGAKPQPVQWKRVGDVKALPLPMACTLSQFTDENRYYFIVRGVDIYNRTGPFCEPANIILKKKH